MKKVLLYGFVFVLVAVRGSNAQDLRLWYRQPAREWTEALPIGNGDLGAMIFGGAGEEHLQLNESTWWTGRPRSYQREDAWQYLDTLRHLLFAGRQAEAEALAQQHFMGKKDPDEGEYEQLKAAWFRKVRADTGEAMANPAGWATMELPTPDGWERAGLEGVDGAVWFQQEFELPADLAGKDLTIDLGRIRDMDFTYVNGQLIGTAEGISTKRHYVIPAAYVHTGRNRIAVQVLNFSDKGGFTGVKGDKPAFVVYGAGGRLLRLAAVWRYKIQDAAPPEVPQYEAAYQPFGDLYLKFAGGTAGTERIARELAYPEDYTRALDLRTAVAKTAYVAGGVHYTREYLCSAANKALVVHLTADRPGHISFQAALGTPEREFSVRRVDAHTIALDEKAQEGVLRGVAWLRVEASGGRVTVSDTGIEVRGADKALVLLTGATSFVNYRDVSGDAAAECAARMRSLQGLSWSALREAHVREYQRLFSGFEIGFGDAASPLPTDERIIEYSPGKDPGLLALYVQYARYLLIASSRPDAAYPANLQGIWNDELTPPWGSKYTTNINLEMNYWPAEALHLSSCSDPLFRLIGNLAVAGQATAKDYYGAPGWVLHHNTDLWCGTAPINASNHGIWPTGGAWLCHQIWEHYLYTRDKVFLQRYYGVMRSAAAFFVHFLIPDPRTGRLISTPSASPEHGGLVAGPTMDHQIIRDLFHNCIAAARVLGTDAEAAGVWAREAARLAPNRIGRYGQLEEWLEDKDDTADTHRHISHLWGVYPGTDITWKDSAMMKAARQSLIYRGDGGTGWSLAWKVNCWARFRDGDHALLLVDKLLSNAVGATGEHGGVYPNLFDAHPPFQIDGNFGGAAGIAEMLVQSQDSVIELLPALPHALAAGSVKGLCARGGFELEMYWSGGLLQGVTVKAPAGGNCMLRYKGRELRVVLRAGEAVRFDGRLKRVS